MKLNPHHQKTFLGDISSFRLVIANGDDEERCITATWLNAKGAPVGMDVQTEFCQIAFQSPPPQANGRFVGAIFAENQ